MQCSKCKKELAEDNFAIDKNRKRGRACRCKECQKKLSQNHFEKNKGVYRERNNQRMKLLFEWLHEYKSKLKCELCGYDKHPAALDFHHIGNDKVDGVPQVMANTKNKERTLEEIKKCIVVCSNCHRILHYERDRGETVDA